MSSKGQSDHDQKLRQLTLNQKHPSFGECYQYESHEKLLNASL